MKTKEKDYYKTEIFGRIFALSNGLQNYLDRVLKDDGLTVKQMFTMLAIEHFDEKSPTLKDIATLLQSSHQNVKQLVNKLEKNGYVHVRTDKKDRRSLRIELSDQAKTYWSSHDLEHNIRLDNLFKGFTEEELFGMFQGILKLSKNIELEEGQH